MKPVPLGQKLQIGAAVLRIIIGVVLCVFVRVWKKRQDALEESARSKNEYDWVADAGFYLLLTAVLLNIASLFLHFLDVHGHHIFLQYVNSNELP